MKTKKSKKDSLIIKLIDGDRHKHRVALVTDEGEWNQHEPNTGMARMFVVMLLIHVVLIGGIIVYDFMGEEEAPAQTITQAARAQTSYSGLPQASQEVINILLEPLQVEIQRFNMLEEPSQPSAVVTAVVHIGVTHLITVMVALGDQAAALQVIATVIQDVVVRVLAAKAMLVVQVKANTMQVVVVVLVAQADQDEATEVHMVA
jgi:hypothetical protein